MSRVFISDLVDGVLKIIYGLFEFTDLLLASVGHKFAHGLILIWSINIYFLSANLIFYGFFVQN
jgi:hypothetical protein